MKDKLGKYLLLIQGFYYAITALWPIIHINSFMYVTGPKTDLWLVKCVSVLILVICVPFFLAVIRKRLPEEIAMLALASSLGLAAIDFYYAGNKVISSVYLIDGAVQMVFILLWSRPVLFPSEN